MALALTFVPIGGAQADSPAYAFVNDTVTDHLTAGATFSYQFTTTDDPSTFTVNAGELPPGLTLTGGGLLSGTVTESGSYTFQLEASHSASVTALSATHALTVDPTYPLHLSPAYGDHQITPVSTNFIGPLGVLVVDDHGYPARDQAVVFTVRPYAPNYRGVLFGAIDPSKYSATTGPHGVAYTGSVYSLSKPLTAYVDVALVTGSGSAVFTLIVKPRIVPSADLRLTLTAPARVKIKKRVAVGLQIDNLGPTSADKVVTTLKWPSGWSVVDAGTGTVSGRSLTFAADPVDSDIPLTYAVTLKSSSHRGAATLKATTTAETPDPSTRNNADRAPVKLVATGSAGVGVAGAPTTDVPTTDAAPIGVPPGGGSGYVRAFGGYVDQGVARASSAGGPAAIPPAVVGHRMRAIAAGSGFSMSLGLDGRVHAWGYDSNGDTRVPANLDGLKVIAIAAHGAHSLALTSTGKVVAWGEDVHGESTVPARVKKQKIVGIAAGDHHSLALTSKGEVLGWGDDSFHQTTVPSSLKGKKVVSVAGGSLHSLAATADGSVVAWGSDWRGETDVPVALQGQKVIQVSAGRLDSLALTGTGHVVPWGYDEDGQEENVPAGGVAGIASGEFHHVAVGTDGTFYGWGQNHDGEVSNPYADELTRAVAAGFDHTLVLVDPTQGGFFADNPPASVFAGVPYLYAFAAFGNPAPTFTVDSGSLPPGLTLSADGILSGEATTPGTYHFTIRAGHGGNPDVVTPERSITVGPGNARVVIVSGDQQSTALDQPFAKPLVLKVLDDQGHPLSRLVNLSLLGPPTSTGSANFVDGTSTAAGYTDADGVYTSPPVNAGNRTGLVNVAVTLGDDDATGTFHLAVDTDASPVADLAVALDAPAKAKKHVKIDVTVTAANDGPSSADFVASTLSWPSGWRLVDPAGGTVSGRSVVWDAATVVASGAASTHTVQLVTSRTAGPGTLRASTTSTTTDPSSADNSTTAKVKVR